MTRRVLITGSSAGIGAAAAAAFASAGWSVVGVDRIEGASEDLEQFVELDLAKTGAIDTIAQVVDGLDRLDAVVNNAALQINSSLLATSDEDWDSTMAVNVRIAFQIIRATAPLLAKTRGAVVNVSSVHAVATSENVAAYAISKGALAALTRSAALELGPSGVRCNAVLPGAVDTEMLRAGMGRRAHPDGAAGNMRKLAGATPLRFIATPQQLAPTILHLADGEQSPYTTGQLLVVDGGASLRLGTE